MTCELCGLSKTCKTPEVPMEVGTEDFRVLLIGEAPGEEEDTAGRPFVGKSGKLLRAVMGDVLPDGVRPWITNAVKCRPLKNKLSGVKAINACKAHLLENILACQPHVIIPLGSTALQSLLGLGGVTAARGRRFTYTYQLGDEVITCPVFPTFHPAFLLRVPGELKTWISDIQRALDYDGSKALGRPTPFRVVSLPAFLKHAQEAGGFVFDIETNNQLAWRHKDAFITQLGFGTDTPAGYVVAGGYPDQFSSPDWEVVKSLFTSDTLLKRAHNAKFDMSWIRAKLGIEVSAPIWCTMAAYYVAVSEELSASLDTLSYLYTEWGGYKEEYWDGVEGGKKGPFTREEFESRSEEWKESHRHYNYMDCYVTDLVYKQLRPLVDADEGFWFVFYKVLMEAYHVLVDMEINGLYIDAARYAQYRAEVLKRQAKYCFEAWEELLRAGVKGYDLWYDSPEDYKGYQARPKRHPSKSLVYLNLASPIHLRDILYRQLKLEIVLTTEETNSPSTNKQAMSLLLGTKDGVKCKFLQLLKSWRTVNTLWKMFIQKLPAQWDDECLVHPRYTPIKDVGKEFGEAAGTVTGRLASSDPNVQQTPRPPEPLADGTPSPLEGVVLRNLYCSRWEDGVILAPDYSQIELRWAAIISLDETMIRLFNSGGDIHLATAAEVFGLPVDKVSKDLRRQAKAVNFGILYGEGEQGLAENLGISSGEARVLIEKYFQRFPGIKRYINDVSRRVRRDGYIRTFFGRMRRLSGAKSVDRGLVASSIRQAVNADPQGSASDMTLLALVKMRRAFRERGWNVLLCGTIHDSIILDCPGELKEAALPVVKDCMESWPDYDFPIPIRADMSLGPSWGEAKELVENSCSV